MRVPVPHSVSSPRGHGDSYENGPLSGRSLQPARHVGIASVNPTQGEPVDKRLCALFRNDGMSEDGRYVAVQQIRTLVGHARTSSPNWTRRAATPSPG